MDFVLIDKSWLQSISTKDLIEFTVNKTIIVPASLAYELITTKQEQKQIENFNKLNYVRSSTRLIEHVGSLLQYEKRQKKSCLPIQKQLLLPNFNYVDNLFEPRKKLDSGQLSDIKYHKMNWEIQGESEFINISSGVNYWFPELNKIKAGSNIEQISDVVNKIASDNDLIREIYAEVKNAGELTDFPNPKEIDQNWACFRYIQLHLLAGTEYIRKYGPNNKNVKSGRFINDNIDLEYAILSTLINAIATNDKTLKWYFKVCCPNGKIYETQK